MDLLTRLKSAEIKRKPIINLPEISYLQEPELQLIINRGFTELYRQKPENPILFLGKWLKKESQAKELDEKYQEDEKKRNKLIKIDMMRHEENRKQAEEKQKKKNKEQEVLDDLKIYITNCENFWDNFNIICEKLKRNVNATGVYIGIYDFKRKPVKPEDDENGHIHPSMAKVLRYIGWCNDHEFLKGKCLESNQGVTFDLITPMAQIDPNLQQQQQEQVNQENQVGDQPQDANKPIEPKEDINGIQYKLISDVIDEPKIHFFREPRLGCYLSLDITYKTCLSYTSLLSAIQAVKEYEENKEKQEQRYKEWQEQKEQIEKEIEEIQKSVGKKEEIQSQLQPQDVIQPQGEQENKNQQLQDQPKQEQEQQPQSPEEMKNNPDSDQQQQAPKLVQAMGQTDTNTGATLADIQNLQNMIVEWKEEPVKLGEYTKEDKKLILALDTLGQDRIFTEAEIKYIQEIATTIRDFIQLLEQKLLEKDRNIRIDFEKKEVEIKAMDIFSEEKKETLLANVVTDYFASEEFKEKNITDEVLKGIDGDLAKASYISSIIYNEGLSQNLSVFGYFEFVEYEKIFQNLLYFVKTEPVLINEPMTNKLQWKTAKKEWKTFLTKLQEFQPRGPKPDEVNPIFKLNKIKANLESVLEKKEEVKEYSFSLYQLVDYVLLLIKIRYDDIIQRFTCVSEKKEEREKVLKQNAEIDREREKIKEQVNVPQIGENGEPIEFDLEEALIKFDQANPQFEVPEDVDYDLDLDYDIK